MVIEEITDNHLADFCAWYAQFHGCKPVEASVISTCICGYFGTYSKAADKLLARCKRLKLLDVADGIAIMRSP